jgi:hypothetical protein
MSISKFFVSALVLVSAISAFPSQSVNTFAAENSARIVTADNGLNIRDSKCNKIGGVGYGNVLVQNSNQAITCTIGGQSVKMINYYPENSNGSYKGDNTYVAESYTQALNRGSSDLFKIGVPNLMFKVNASGGLNLRDQNCKRIMFVPNGTELTPVVSMGPIKVCKANSEFYSMTDVTYNGKNYMVADMYLQVK